MLANCSPSTSPRSARVRTTASDPAPLAAASSVPVWLTPLPLSEPAPAARDGSNIRVRSLRNIMTVVPAITAAAPMTPMTTGKNRRGTGGAGCIIVGLASERKVSARPRVVGEEQGVQHVSRPRLRAVFGDDEQRVRE